MLERLSEFQPILNFLVKNSFHGNGFRDFIQLLTQWIQGRDQFQASLLEEFILAGNLLEPFVISQTNPRKLEMLVAELSKLEITQDNFKSLENVKVPFLSF